MTLGTRSVLFGAHCFFIHPWFVAAAWTRLYGFPTDPRLWLAFLVHDLGYVGKPNILGEEGEKHAVWGADVMHLLCDSVLIERRCLPLTSKPSENQDRISKMEELGFVRKGTGPAGIVAYLERRTPSTEWRDFTLYHSLYYARKDNRQPSRLCLADQLALCLEPWWFYLPRVWVSGELRECLGSPSSTEDSEEDGKCSFYQKVRRWHQRIVANFAEWVQTHKNSGEYVWTLPPVTGR